MAIKEQIDSILAVRKQKGDGLKKKKEMLESIKSSLRACDGLYTQAKGLEDEKLRAQYMGLFSKVQTKKVQQELDRLIRRLDEGTRRFNRDYISIATVGRARQGKSRFLQSVGSLDDRVIPAYDAGDCTGAVSIIHNTASMEPGQVRADISFKQPGDLVSVAEVYIRQIDPEYLEESSLYFDDIPYISLPGLEMKIGQYDNDKKTAFKHLSRMVEHLDDIRDLFGHSMVSLTDPEQIKRYVAQNNGRKQDDPEREEYFKYLAVARADIYCHFYEDCGKIILVDTVGIGDTQAGIEQSMLDTVDKECDAAIVVTKPDAGVRTEDIAIYNQLKDAFMKRNLQQWLFYVANLHKGRNDNAVDLFTNEIRNGNYAVCDARTVDCSDKDNVRDGFMNPMLMQLVGNMESIDNAYLKEINDQIKMFMKHLTEFLAEMPEAKTFDPGTQAGIKAFLKGKECYHQMTADLRKQVRYWNEEREKPNGVLWSRVQHILYNMDELAPSAEVLQKVIEENGSLVAMDLWNAALNYTRNEITDMFIDMDGVLEKETRIFKNSLVKSLYYALKNIADEEEDDISGMREENADAAGEKEGQGKADEAQTDSTGGESADTDHGEGEAEEPDMTLWLETVMDRVIGDKPQYAQIHKAFRFLCEFEFNTRAQLVQEIRRHLYIINPTCKEYAMPYITNENEGYQVYFYLTSRLTVIEENLRYSLVNLYRTPNQAFFAAAEEFYDRLTFASNLKDGQFVSMDTVWGQFFMEYSNKLWAENTTRYEPVNALVERYNELLGTLNGLAENAVIY